MDALTVFATKRVKQTLKTLKVFSFILIVFTLCMLPHHVVYLIYSTNEMPKEIELFEMFIYINAAVNPWIYTGMNKSYRVAFEAMFRRHKQRKYLTSSSNFSVNSKNDSCFISCKKLFACLQNQRTHDDEATSEFLSERSDTVKSMDFDFTTRLGSTGSRKDSKTSRKDSKTSRKESTVSEYDHIPSLAPIIIITNYDEEMAAQQALLQAGNDGNEEDESKRFSAILSFNDA